MKNKMFQPGTILHEVIVGAFRAKGTSCSAWCGENDVPRNTARAVTYGQSGGETGNVPETLSYQINLNSPISADVKHVLNTSVPGFRTGLRRQGKV